MRLSPPIPSRPIRSACFAVLGCALLCGGAVAARQPAAEAGPVRAIEARSVNIIVPQQRCYAPMPIEQRLSIAGVEADIRIVDQAATTTLRITIANRTGRDQEGELLLPVPAESAVRSFGISGPAGGVGAEPTARILPRDEARREYERIVRELKDPGLLEFAGYNLVKSSVFPVPAAGQQIVTLVYEHVARGAEGGNRFDYVLPRSETFESTSIPWTISATIESRRPIATVYSPSHAIVTKQVSPGKVTVELGEEAAREPSPFRLSCLLQPQNGLAATLLAYPDAEAGGGEGGGYFLLLAGAPALGADDAGEAAAEDGREEAGGPGEGGREVIIVIDRSGSMRGEKMEQARAAAIQVVSGLADGEAFNIIDYSDTIATFAPQPVLKTAETLAGARAYLAGLKAEGGTNIHDALQVAMRMTPTEGMLPMVLFLTDGLPTAGDTSEIDIRKHTEAANEHKRRIFTFGVGFDVNAPLLDKIAQVARGASVNVLPSEDVEVAVSTVFKRLSGPVLAWPTLAAVVDGDPPPTAHGPAIRDVMPSILPDLFEGDQLVVLGRYTNVETLKLRLTGDVRGEQRSFEFSFDLREASNTHAYVPRLWASRRIATLIDAVRQAGASAGGLDGGEPSPATDELVQEIVRLSTKFGILTEYTAFLATDASGGAVAANIPLEEALLACSSALDSRAVGDRSGQGAVNQSLNIKGQQAQTVMNKSNGWVNADMEVETTTSICQINDLALYNRAGKWIDSRISMQDEDPTENPDRVIDFGSDEYFALVRELVDDNRQGVVALSADLCLEHRGEVILIRGPQ